MDLQSILPLLMKNGNNSDFQKILSAFSSKNGTDDLFKNLVGGNNSQYSALFSMLKNNNGNKKIMGLEPIKDIANDEIFGRITKFFLD
jgi:hypothetical protein